ncbi:DNA-directed DNA polymerase [Pleosporales sp. CAS-2024a]
MHLNFVQQPQIAQPQQPIAIDMADKSRKRVRDPAPRNSIEATPVKRRRQMNEEQIKLSKLYEDLAAESDDVRLGAAKELILKFSPGNRPSASDVNLALRRLIKGLCSQRKAARIGFSLTLTELLREIFGQAKTSIEDLDLDVGSLIKLVQEKTKVEGNVPGRERRDHLIGRLFGYKSVLQSSIVIKPELSMECWNNLLDHICGMARDVPWLREECGMVLVEAIKSLQGQQEYEECAKEVISRLNAFKLTSTPEAVAIWLAVQVGFAQILPDGIWHDKDPLSKKERARLAKILKENYQDAKEVGSGGAVKTSAASPNPHFAWNLVISEILRRDEQNRSEDAESSKTEFAQFWIDTVDSNLFASTSSHERKAWGFKLLSSAIFQVPESDLSSLFSPNLMRTLFNQSKKEDRFLHSAALAVINAIQAKTRRESKSALPIFIALTSKNGSIDFDKITKTKTLEHILSISEDNALRKIVRHLNSLILRPGTEEQTVADSRRLTIADLLLNMIKHYTRYEDASDDFVEKDGWLYKTLEVFVEYAYFVPSQSAKTSKMPLPAVGDRSRQMFQERLSSCLTKLLSVETCLRSNLALAIVGMIRSKSASSKSLDLAFKADKLVMKTLENAFQTLDAISAKGSIAGNKMAAEGFILLYSLTLLQVYNGEGDAVMLLDDLDVSRKALLQKAKGNADEGSDVFVEIILSFLGNPRTLFRKIGEEVLSIFASEISAEGLRSLTDILETKENIGGQKELFDNEDDDDDVDEEDSSDDSEVDSDVEMVDGEDQGTEDEESDESGDSTNDEDSGSDETTSEDDAELTQFNNLLAMTLQTSKPTIDGEAAEETSDESDMDDEQMMALDPQLSQIFKQRSKTTSKKKEREEAKQNVVQFKARVLDLLAVYLEKQYSNPLTLNVLLPILRRTRAEANKQLAEKAYKVLKTFFDPRTKHKAPLPKPDDLDAVWEALREIHQEAKLGGGAKLHADACSSASLHLVKVLVGVGRENYAGVVDVYAATQKEWFAEKRSALQPVLFSSFHNWSLNARQVGR